MSTPQLILWIAAIVVVGPAAWLRYITAVALLCAFFVSEAGLPLWYYPYSDAAVIAVIMLKADRSPADWFILACYPLAWCSYIFNEPLSHAQWWQLFWIAIVQFFAIGAETLVMFWRWRARVKAQPSSIIDRHLVVIPIQRRHAEAVMTTPVRSGAMLIAAGGGGSG